MLVSFGLDHSSARLEVRERFSLSDEDVPRVHAHLGPRGVEETVLTRTCNRVEAYCWWPDSGAREASREMVHAWVGGDAAASELLLAHGRLRTGPDAARHLMRVASGLESQILGDIHILGQVRRAFGDAVDARTTGAHLHRLFELALRVGKQVRHGTSLMASRSGVGSEAARAAQAHLGGLAGRTCVVVGCGKSGTHAARCLVEGGATDVVLLNRTVERARDLARDLASAKAAGLDALPAALRAASVVVVATGSSQPVLTRAMLEEARRGRAGEPALLVIDVSVPRNVEAAAAELAGVELLDLDALHPETAELERARRAAVPEAEALVEDGVQEFLGWLDLKSAGNALRPLRELITEVCRRELTHVVGVPDLAERATHRVVARVMASPMMAMRSAAQRGEPIGDLASAVRSLFEGPEGGPDRRPTAASG